MAVAITVSRCWVRHEDDRIRTLTQALSEGHEWRPRLIRVTISLYRCIAISLQVENNRISNDSEMIETPPPVHTYSTTTVQRWPRDASQERKQRGASCVAAALSHTKAPPNGGSSDSAEAELLVLAGA